MNVIYYVACSLDGYIGTPDGGVDWLEGYHDEGEDCGYPALMEACQVLLMGSGTYDFVGIPLFAAGGDREPLEHQATRSYPSGMVQLTYQSRSSQA